MSRLVTIPAALEALRVVETMTFAYMEDLATYSLRVMRTLEAGESAMEAGKEWKFPPIPNPLTGLLTPEAMTSLVRLWWLSGEVSPGLPSKVSKVYADPSEAMPERFKRVLLKRALPQETGHRRRRWVYSRN